MREDLITTISWEIIYEVIEDRFMEDILVESTI